MKKDKILSIRINSEIKEQLEKDGYTVQQLLDEAIYKMYIIKEIIKKK